MKKSIFIVLLLFVLIFIVLLNYDNNEIKEFTKISYSNIDELIDEQQRVEKDLMKLSKNKIYTFDNPLIINNPYSLVPLSYVIVFQTDEKETIKVYINDVYISETENTKNHVIPIYGLINNENNNIKLISGDKEKNISLEKVSVDVIDLDVKINKIEKTYLSFTSNNTFASMIFDTNGKLVWNFESNMFSDTIKLENGNLLTTYGQENYTYLLEIDYLGKIYNSYKIDNHIDHTLNEFGNYYSVITKSKDQYRRNDTVYLINKKNGKIEYNINLLDILGKVSKQFYEEKLTDPDWAHVNSVYLNEEDSEILISLRKPNSIISVNYKTMKLNYIINSSNYYSGEFDNYIINPGFDMLSQHSINMDKEGNYFIFNNNVNRIKHLRESIEVYEDKKDSYPIIFSIDKDTKKVTEIWKYIYKDKVLFAPAFSSFQILEDEVKLINYSCLIEPENGIYYFKNQYMKILMLNDKDEIIFEADKKDDSVVNVYNFDIYDNYNNQNKNNKLKEYIVK